MSDFDDFLATQDMRRPSTDELLDTVDPWGDGPTYFDKQGQPITMRQWTELRWDRDGDNSATGISDYARVGYTELAGGVWVSTVWLGMDHGWGMGRPVLFETMIFCKHDNYPYDSAQMRYCTEEEAREGHDRTVLDLIAGHRPWFLEQDE